MSKIVSEMPNHHRNRYPWAEWFDGQTRLLEAGTDFRTSPDSFRSVIYLQSKRMNVRATVRIRPEGVYLQAVPRDQT